MREACAVPQRQLLEAFAFHSDMRDVHLPASSTSYSLTVATRFRRARRGDSVWNVPQTA
jgi:hypothetical protein